MQKTLIRVIPSVARDLVSSTTYEDEIPRLCLGMTVTTKSRRREGLEPFSFLAVIFLSLLLRANCAQAAQSWQGEWEKTVKAAEAEGEVAVYVVDYPRFAVSQFQKAFPKIKLVSVDGPSGPALSSRLMAERRAGKYLADLYIAGQGTHVSILYPAKALAPMPPALILPEVNDESKWFKGKHRYVDPETRHSFVFQGHRGLYVSYNTSQVRAGDIKSWSELINPKWKGKIIGYDPAIAGVARNVLWYLYKNKSLGPEFMSKLYGDMEMIIGRDQRQLVDWLAAGKAAVCIACDDADLGSAKENRLPVETITQTLKEGDYVAAGQGVISLITPAPHANAAQVFLNWFLSREGQTIYQEQSVKSGQRNANSRRMDIAKDVIRPEYRLKENSEVWENGADVDKETAEATKLLKEILAKKAK
jgi:iron(III) transport system substrate-binding protein